MKSVGIIGGGLAGLTAAVSLSERGYKVKLFHLNGSNSERIQAGISLPITSGDSLHLHAMDTMRVGLYINDEDAVWATLSKSTEAYDFLKRIGVRFELVELEAGHSRPRVFSIRNETGLHVMNALREKVEELGVEMLERMAIGLIIEEGKCYGIIDEKGESHFFNHTIIASGGYTGLYKRTAGYPGNTGMILGDYIGKGGIASNLEFVQFHPTGYITSKGKIMLISEAVRGSGAKLVNEEGERFVNELAPRDVVSLAVYRQEREGHSVFLDARNINDFEARFPSIYSYLTNDGIDPLKDLIPITPIAHYSIGGAMVDVYYSTNIKGLYAIGEAADSGFHGANRLASNSSLECIVSGLEVARTLSRKEGVDLSNARPESLKTISSSSFIERVREVMWDSVGLERDSKELINALNFFRNKELPQQIRGLGLGISSCAMLRQESRGAHFRRDYPYIDERYRHRSLYKDGICYIGPFSYYVKVQE